MKKREREAEEVASSRNSRANCYAVKFTERFFEMGVIVKRKGKKEDAAMQRRTVRVICSHVMLVIHKNLSFSYM